MKVFYHAEALDTESDEKKKLYMKDTYLGDYNFGLYSQLQLLLIECESLNVKGLRVITGMNTYVNGIIYEKFGVDVWDLENPLDIKQIILDKTGLLFDEWLEGILNEKIAEAVSYTADS